MMKSFAGVLVLALAITGCSKAPESTPAAVSGEPMTEAHKQLIEGTVFLKQGDAVKAVQSFAGSIKADPDKFEGYLLLAETFIRVQQYTQAEAILIAAVKKFPDNGSAYYLLAVAQDAVGSAIPAIMADRKSAELFAVAGDKENAQKSAFLLAALVAKAKKTGEDQAVADAAKEAKAAVETAVVAATAPLPAGVGQK